MADPEPHFHVPAEVEVDLTLGPRSNNPKSWLKLKQPLFETSSKAETVDTKADYLVLSINGLTPRRSGIPMPLLEYRRVGQAENQGL